MKKRFTWMLVLAGIAVTLHAQALKKQDISVLFVGNSPERELTEEQSKNMAWVSQERYLEELKTRMPAFMSYLQDYFSTVKGVDVMDYTADMSDNYDVTIFDEVVKPIKERVFERDPQTGEVLKYEPAIYLPEDYDRPSVFIGHTGDRLGRSLGSKLDWYCLCLTKWAHSIKTEHPVFQGPFEVDITLEDRPTPEPIFHYFDGGDMPAEIPMWTVNTEDYTDQGGYRIGMVARGWGFEDSPDAEVISSGQCDKQKTAVALGRHGNFFLWGFAGSPDYMTKEAKQVFANAVVYTHRHRDERIIARKYNDRIATKIYLDELLYYTTPEAYHAHVEVYKGFNESSLKAKEEARGKEAAGEELNDMDQMMLNFEPRPINTWEQYMAKNFDRQSWGGQFGTDTMAIRKYISENLDYFYSEPDGMYDLKVDEDCKSLGIANDDIRILDAAISLLEKDEKDSRAKRLLYRYTLEDFTTAEEWRTWYIKYREHMFFTEAGGFVWLINDPAANPAVRPRNDMEAAPAAALELDKPTHKKPVSVGAAIIPSGKEGERAVLIKASIMEGYHIYAFVPAGDPYIKTEYGIELPEGIELLGEWLKPSPSGYPGKPLLLTYKNELEFTRSFKVSGDVAPDAKIKVWFKYQCCDANICFPPETKEIELTL